MPSRAVPLLLKPTDDCCTAFLYGLSGRYALAIIRLGVVWSNTPVGSRFITFLSLLEWLLPARMGLARINTD